ncbi:hypothetical protein DFR52_101376 [Hoeflea marina]|uniref:Tyrosine specific protein phosphatases domain-containing protein n=1 Tax=Hoeflea marina TaxID=274592 RepID=A0A317PW55_9HYPH|nr:hypothetical protein [Hoeflea marina]PWW03690.1 hypothetical protein DFR52_101376 [Hoeflea marina]
MQQLHLIPLPGRPTVNLAVSGVPGLLISANGALALCEETLAAEMNRLRDLNIRTLIGLVEDDELGTIDYLDITDAANSVGIQSIRFQVRDFGIPSADQEADWRHISSHAHELARGGHGFAIHCMAGIGRSFMMAGRILVDFGLPPGEALKTLRAVHPEALETPTQELYLQTFPR